MAHSPRAAAAQRELLQVQASLKEPCIGEEDAVGCFPFITCHSSSKNVEEKAANGGWVHSPSLGCPGSRRHRVLEMELLLPPASTVLIGRPEVLQRPSCLTTRAIRALSNCPNQVLMWKFTTPEIVNSRHLLLSDHCYSCPIRSENAEISARFLVDLPSFLSLLSSFSVSCIFPTFASLWQCPFPPVPPKQPIRAASACHPGVYPAACGCIDFAFVCSRADPMLLSFSLHEAAAQLRERQSVVRVFLHWNRLQPGRQPTATAPAEEAPGGAGTRREGSSETSLPAKAIPITKNHWGTGYAAQLENQHRDQLVPQLQVGDLPGAPLIKDLFYLLWQGAAFLQHAVSASASI